jgi:hypothetical protein
MSPHWPMTFIGQLTSIIYYEKNELLNNIGKEGSLILFWVPSPISNFMLFFVWGYWISGEVWFYPLIYHAHDYIVCGMMYNGLVRDFKVGCFFLNLQNKVKYKDRVPILFY